MDQILIQIIGGIAYLLLTMSYYKKSKKQILFMQIFAYILFSIHYYLLSGITGAICNVIGLFALVTIYLFEKYKLKNKNLFAILFIIAVLVINIISFQNIYSIFPMIALTIVIISFMLNSEKVIRNIGLISAVCWLVYAIVYKSYISIVFEVITLIGVIGAVIKNRKNSK